MTVGRITATFEEEEACKLRSLIRVELRKIPGARVRLAKKWGDQVDYTQLSHRQAVLEACYRNLGGSPENITRRGYQRSQFGRDHRAEGQDPIPTDKELAEMQARCEAAAPGPWGYGDFDDERLVYEEEPQQSAAIAMLVESHVQNRSEANGSFIAHARTDMPKLIAALRTLLDEVNLGESPAERSQ